MEILLIALLSYLIGSVPWALIIGKVFFGKDIRTMGSGNLGTTNMMRNLGKKAGMVVFFLDISKSILSMYIATKVLGDINYLSLFGAFAMLGHIFPVFAGFRGGKAVATASGIFIYLYPVLAIALVAIFFINLFITGYVSLGSIIIATVGAIGVFFIGSGMDKYIMIVMCILVIYMHKSNIVRLKNGTENVSKMKINFKK